ncbi:hypothetical protein GGQ74_000984 [Desulfobaculum xiamenense]|uniref:Uncharacterized protein n=1 Tax=Desulfobaculum xiamenense TaxID=995050 RepID=A0A846QQ52_9BACT|nr:hypothetical protein [Desulfobaculum xiamenense]NJB67344.1 hypothetical protein [Desulfobaculum xiamenense]
MRKLCARCLYWLPPEGKEILCEVEGLCRYHPATSADVARADCPTEACGSCEYWTAHPNPQRNAADY